MRGNCVKMCEWGKSGNVTSEAIFFLFSLQLQTKGLFVRIVCPLCIEILKVRTHSPSLLVFPLFYKPLSPQSNTTIENNPFWLQNCYEICTKIGVSKWNTLAPNTGYV